MERLAQFYINGAWVKPKGDAWLAVENPADRTVIGELRLGNSGDVDTAVAAAKTAFSSYAKTPVADRIALLQSILNEMQRRRQDLIQAVMQEMGAPRDFADTQQVASGLGHIEVMIDVLSQFSFSEDHEQSRVVKEPIGVCGLITPWNWPLNQITCKVAPALAAGCTMVLKPSELAPLSAICFTDILHEAGVPAGVFNLIQGRGEVVGEAMSSHPDIAMMSFTGSTRAGTAVARAAADTVKRVHQELGGNAPNIVLPDADLKKAVTEGVRACFSNSGQSCDSPARLLVPIAAMDEAVVIAKETAQAVKVGAPDAAGVDVGPVISQTHYDKIQRLIRVGLEEGAELVFGGPGHPPGLEGGHYVRPTVFGAMHPGMTTVRTEIFGPVISIIGYESLEQAIDIANDTPYGLAAYVQSGDIDKAREVASRLRAGTVMINGAEADMYVPFGGFKQSGNGREYGVYGLNDYLEYKSIVGYSP